MKVEYDAQFPLPGHDARHLTGSVTAEDFIAWGGYYWKRLVLHYGISAGSRLLEPGCGFGNLARWAIPRVEGYVGFDVNDEAIGFCREALPGGRFEHADVHNGVYAPLQLGVTSEYRFPVNDGWATHLAAMSVWTHLLREDAEHYLREAYRALAPGGTALITAFIGGEYVAREALAVYPWEMFAEMASTAGMVASLQERGDWSGQRPNEWIQDVVRLDKP